jgi:hypothetical protein
VERHVWERDVVHADEAVVPDHEDRRPVRPADLLQDGEEPADEVIDVLQRPPRFRAARPIVVLEAVGNQEVEQQQVRRAAAEEPGRHLEGEPVLERCQRV